MKGIILAGGKGTRLLPLTKITNKHLLPIFDKAMIEYPLRVLLQAGIKDILIVSGREHAGDFVEYLGSGSDYGVKFTYKVQVQAGGIAHALLLAEDFADGGPMTVILGDNIYEDNFKSELSSFKKGAKVFLKEVPDPERFGVATLKGNKIIKIVEKPKKPESNFVTTGLYQYDNKVFDIIKKLKPSWRGELELTDVNNAYVKAGTMKAEMVDGFWSDAGTFDSMVNSINWAVEKSKKK
ncbi:MAG: glucose-1-phosphate thymidylyltransferase [Parcubacteria group bacterium Gr01-1014_46]|nr:MAG: glucose-1-phosphate thymidylyltransferase [Parcubacteria group bacterium Gr01-1014_46]